MIPQKGMDLRIGLDIGGSLAKLVFIEREGSNSPFQKFIVRARHGWHGRLRRLVVMVYCL
jgi:pantothenate kinase